MKYLQKAYPLADIHFPHPSVHIIQSQNEFPAPSHKQQDCHRNNKAELHKQVPVLLIQFHFHHTKYIRAVFYFPTLLSFQDCSSWEHDNESPSLALPYLQRLLFDIPDHPDNILFFQLHSLKTILFYKSYFLFVQVLSNQCKAFLQADSFLSSLLTHFLCNNSQLPDNVPQKFVF